MISEEDKRLVSERFREDREENENLTQGEFRDRLSNWLDVQTLNAARREAIFNYAERIFVNLLPASPVTGESVDAAQSLCRETAEALKRAPWHDTALESWPAPIAHELARLIEELEGTPTGQGQRMPAPASALLQMRDTCEVLIKTIAIILVRALIEYGGDDGKWARAQIFGERSSAGSWRALLRHAAERVRNSNSDAMQAFHGLARAVGSASVAKALDGFIKVRNDAIGHGAMALDPQEPAELVHGFLASGKTDPRDRGKDVTPLTEALTELYEAKAFEGLRMVAVDEHGETAFCGARAVTVWHDHASNDGRDARTVPLAIRTSSGSRLSLAPFMVGRICIRCGRRDVQLFDSVYERRSGRFDLLDYARGHRSRYGAGRVADLAEALKQAGEPLIHEESDGSLNEAHVVERLDRARVERNYLSPEYLRRDLADFITHHDRGIYWLQAPAHVGKTTFVQGLAEPALKEAPIVPERFGPGDGNRVATYYCKKEYRTGSTGFLAVLEDGLRRAFGVSKESTEREPSWQQFVVQCDGAESPGDRQAGFLKWIEAWRARARKHLSREATTPPLLLIVDGLDETDDPEKGESPIDLLPHSGDLPEGLYILLTSRLAEEPDCPGFVASHINPIVDLDKNGKVTRLGLDSEPYLDMLHQYVAARSPRKLDHKETLKVIEHAQRRFIYVSFLTQRLVELGDHINLQELGEGEELYANWLAGLDREYGNKRAEAMREVILFLAAAEEAHAWVYGAGRKIDLVNGEVLTPLPEDWRGLPIKVLAVLTQQDRPDEVGSTQIAPSLLFTLAALQSALGVWRGDDGTARYRLGLKGILPAVRQNSELARQLPRFHARLASTLLDVAENIQRDGWSDSNWALFSNLAPLTESAVELSCSDVLRERASKTKLDEIANSRDDEWNTRGEMALRIKWLTFAIATLTPHDMDSVAQAARIPYFPTISGIATAYARRGLAMRDRGDFDNPLRNFDVAIALRETAVSAQYAGESPRDVHNQPNDYINRGHTKDERGDFQGAIEDYGHAIEILETYLGISEEYRTPVLVKELANAYLNRGMPLFNLGRYDEAVADYDKSIELKLFTRGRHPDSWQLHDQSALSTVWMNRANARNVQNDYAGAVQDYGIAMKLLEPLRQYAPGKAWLRFYQQTLGNICMNRAMAKDRMGNTLEAIQDLDMAAKLMEEVREHFGAEWPIPHQMEFARVFVNRGSIRTELGQFDAAINDIYTAIRIQESAKAAAARLGFGWPQAFDNDIATSHRVRAKATQHRGNNAD